MPNSTSNQPFRGGVLIDLVVAPVVEIVCHGGVLIDLVVAPVVETVSDVHVVVNDLVMLPVSDVILVPVVVTFHLLIVTGDVAQETHSADLDLQLGQGLGQNGGQDHVQGQDHEQNDGLIHRHTMTSSLHCQRNRVLSHRLRSCHRLLHLHLLYNKVLVRCLAY